MEKLNKMTNAYNNISKLNINKYLKLTWNFLHFEMLLFLLLH